MENSIVVRCKKALLYELLTGSLGFLIFLVVLIADMYKDHIPLLNPITIFAVAFWALYSIGGSLTLGRTFVLGPEGVTVSLPWLHYRRFYPWRELTVHHEEYTLALLLCLKSEIGAVIIQRKKAWFKKPKFLLPGLYAIFFRPLSTIYLHFYEDLNLSGRESAYMVHKEEFLEKMSAFGVLTPEFYKEIQHLPKL